MKAKNANLHKAKNANLHKAKKEANDEFYTQYEDIAKEIEHYKEHLKGKVVYCNCDIPYFSNFHKYFLDNFKELELKQLIVTGYVKNGNGKCSIYDGERATDYDLLGDGDFRGDECIDMLQKADVIITNPPFSLFREFIKVVVDNRKDFIVVGNKNATTYKDVFPLFMKDKMFIGVTVPNDFITPLGETKKINGLSRWFTSFNVRDNEYLHLTKEYSSLCYPRYDNYDAINIDKVKDIPKDYKDVMGVPITFLDKYNPNQFEILGATQRGCHDDLPDIKKYDDYWEVRQPGEKTGSRGGKTNENANLEMNDGKKNYFINAEGHVVQSAYQRIFIRHKTKEINDTLQNKRRPRLL